MQKWLPRKHIFGVQIENNMLENHADQREMVLLFSFFFYVVATSKGITSDFSSATDCLMDPKKMTSCVAPCTGCIYCFSFAGTLALAYRVGSSKASVLVRKLAQFKCFEHVVERKLSGYNGNIPFYFISETKHN